MIFKYSHFVFGLRRAGNLFCGSHHFRFLSSGPPPEQIRLPLAYTEYQFDNDSIDPLSPALAPILITHGLLGSKQNWGSIAKALAKASNRTVITFDARNHGESPDSQHMNYEVMVEDVLALAERVYARKFVLMGHSMGGRTAACFALKYARKLTGLIVVDISPLNLGGDFDIMKKYLEIMIEFQFEPRMTLANARKSLDEKLAEVESDPSIRSFLLTNLTKGSGRVEWRPNLEVLLKNLKEIKAFPPKFLSMQSQTPTLFVRGEKSNYLPETDFSGIKKLFPNSEFVSIGGAGHWPHADAPHEFLNCVITYLRNVD